MEKRKTLLIGWDAADWKVIDPLLAQGKMPHLKKLIEGGVRGNLATLQPVLSPMLWSSIATGKRAYKHGVHGFSEPDPSTGFVRPVTNLSRKTKAIWNILNQEEMNTITVGWWPSNPAEPLSKGVMVANDYQVAMGKDLAHWPMKKGTIHPERLIPYLKELRFHPSELTEEDVRPFMPGLEGMSREELDEAEKHPAMRSLMKIIADCTTVHSAATALMQNEPWDLMSVYYDAIDHFSHAFMKYHPPQRDHIPDWEYRLYNYCVEAGYIYHDMMLGTLMHLAGEDTTVMLISDHGFHSDELRPRILPNEPAGPAAEHREYGVIVAKGPGIKQGGRVFGASLLDICPTLLHLFDKPVGEDMDGKVLLDLYEGQPKKVEWIPSWDTREGDHGMHPKDLQIAPSESKEALEQLVALGYIDAPPEDQEQAVKQTVRELEYNLAQAYIGGGVYTEAASLLVKLYEEWPKEHRFGLKLAFCYEALGLADELEELVKRLIANRLKDAEESIAEIKEKGLDTEEGRKSEQERVEAMSDQEQKKYARDRRDLILRAQPNLIGLRRFEAKVDIIRRDYATALEKIEVLETDHGARLSTLLMRGGVCQKLHRWEESEDAFTDALELDAENSDALLGLARTAIAQRRFEDAVDFCRRSIELLFFQPRAHYLMGLALYRQGEWQEAEYSFLLCVKQSPVFAAGYRMLGEIARVYKHDPHAVVFYKQQVKEARERKRDLLAKRQNVTTAAPDSFASYQEEDRLSFSGDSSLAEGVTEKQVITLVSGLPRSGTSLMMQMLEASGMPVFTDGARCADDSNARGYYEHDAVSGLLQNAEKAWIKDSRGHAIKVVAPLLHKLPVKLNDEKLEYRVLFMEREMDEIIDSQSTMLEKLGRKKAEKDISRAYMQQVRAAKQWIKNKGVPAISVPYSELVHDPYNLIAELAQFLDLNADQISKMREVIDPAMHRSRSSV